MQRILPADSTSAGVLSAKNNDKAGQACTELVIIHYCIILFIVLIT